MLETMLRSGVPPHMGQSPLGGWAAVTCFPREDSTNRLMAINDVATIALTNRGLANNAAAPARRFILSIDLTPRELISLASLLSYQRTLQKAHRHKSRGFRGGWECYRSFPQAMPPA